MKKKELLYQYKESLEGEKKESFQIEAGGEYSEEVKRDRELAKIRYKLKLQHVQSLETPAPRLATDFYTSEEMNEKAAFKKPKKKKKGLKTKMLKADDLLAMSGGAGEEQAVRRRRERVVEEQVLPDGRLPRTKEKVVEEAVEGDVVMGELDPEPAIPRALIIARKLAAGRGRAGVDRVAEVVAATRGRGEEEPAEGGVELVLDQTAEFCRGLGEVGHWQDLQSGLAGGKVDKELLEFEAGLEQEAGARMRSAVEWSKQMDVEERVEEVREKEVGRWEQVEEVEVEEGKWKEGARGGPRRRGERGGAEGQGDGKQKLRPAILEEEELARTGMGAVLNMARRKGFLDNEEEKAKDMGLKELKCVDYKIDDKSRKDQEEDDRKRGRGRQAYGGATSSFTEKKDYKPTVGRIVQFNFLRNLPTDQAPKQIFLVPFCLAC